METPTFKRFIVQVEEVGTAEERGLKPVGNLFRSKGHPMFHVVDQPVQGIPAWISLDKRTKLFKQGCEQINKNQTLFHLRKVK